MSPLIQSMRLAALCTGLFSSVGTMSLAQVPVAGTSNDTLSDPFTVSSRDNAATLHLSVGQSLVLHAAAPVRRVYVGNPEVLQSFNSSPQEIVLTAKAPGVSSLVLWDTASHSRVYSVSTDVDAAGLRQSLAEAFPDSHLSVEGSGEHLTLRGSVPNQDMADAVAKLAGQYAKNVDNALRVVPTRGKQIRLQLQILEVDRNKLEQFGINLSYSKLSAASTSTNQFSNPLNLAFYNARTGIGVQVQDLEQKQIVQILAEPTLTTLSGQPARFLSGGEFPVPVAQAAQTAGGGSSGTAITVVFKPYGVKVDFTPTINHDGTVRLKIAPEVSTLDYSNAVTLSGFTIPALSTRRAESEVDLRDGQKFVLTGLLDRRTSAQLGGAPGIENVPVLGQVFRSKNVSHSMIELIMTVRVSIVDPPTEPSADPPRWPLPGSAPPMPLENLNPAKLDDSVRARKP